MHTTFQRPIEFPPWKSDIDLIKEFLALERRSATSYTPYIRLQRTKIYSGRSRECARECVPVRRAFGFEAHVHVYVCVYIYVCICVGLRVWRTTRETDDRAPLTLEPHTGLVWELANGYGVPRDD